MAAVAILARQLPAFASDWRRLFRRTVEDAALHPSQLLPAWHNDLVIFRGVALAAGLSWVIATGGGLAQGGPVFAPSALAPNLNRLNPISRLGQLFSLNALSRALKSLLPTAVLGSFALGVLQCDWSAIPPRIH